MDDQVTKIEQFKDQLEALDRLIRRLDPAVRAALIELLKPYRSGSAAGKRGRRGETARVVAPPSAPGARPFRPTHPQMPGDNVIRCAAMILSERPQLALSADEIRSRAEAMGLRVPRDPLRTLRIAREGGKALFRFEDGRWKLTATGSAQVQKRLGIRLPATARARSRKQSAGRPR